MKKQLFYGLMIFCVLGLMASCTKKERRLPFLQQEVTGKDTTYRTIPDFKFLNQDSTIVTHKDFEGKIYVADFFFTSCPTICPVMHRNLLKVYDKYKDNPEVKLASHTIDVKYDTPSRMKEYAHKLGVTGEQWEFLWGTRDSIYAIAERNYLVTVGADNKAAGGFIHQGYLVLIDKHRRVRGYYDGTVEEQVKQLMDDMDVLLEEE
jgi:protein SCO1/2